MFRLKPILFFLLFISLILNVWLFVKVKAKTGAVFGGDSQFQQAEKKYPLLAKRILVEYPNDLLIRFSPLRKELREMTAAWSGKFAFYFEYLPTGVSIGVNEKDEFSAASLLKVPVVMSYYLQQERENKTGDGEVALTEAMIHKDYGNLWKRGVGAKVSIDEAIRLALEESDNTAVEVVISKTNYTYFQEVYDGLDIELKEIHQIPIITAKNYSSILKALYFSSIVNKEHSDKILSHLSRSVYRDKLPAGVPENIKVAHKIGEAGNDLFTDCGIVYVPRRPYLLCMLSFSDDETAKERMVAVSKKVYDYISSTSQ